MNTAAQAKVSAPCPTRMIMPDMASPIDHENICRMAKKATSGSPRELIERFGREDMEEVFLDMARGRGRGLDSLKKDAAQ